MGDGGVEILVAGNLAYSWFYTIASQNLHKLHLLSPAAYFSQLPGAVSSESSRTSSVEAQEVVQTPRVLRRIYL